MILYVNGDSNSGGAEALNTHCFAKDDPKYEHLGRAPHPENLAVSYGKLLADQLTANFVCDAQSGSSNQRIIRKTKEYLKTARPDLIIIGWASWDREEFLIDGKYWQFGVNWDFDGGYPPVPDNVKQFYKKWVLQSDLTFPFQKQVFYHDVIYNFHKELTKKSIPHLFFNAHHAFDADLVKEYNWHGNYIEPYTKSMTYFHWLCSQGFEPTLGYHFKAEAHPVWANFLLTYLKKERIITT